jgi:hypothetical protein
MDALPSKCAGIEPQPNKRSEHFQKVTKRSVTFGFIPMPREVE